MFYVYFLKSERNGKVYVGVTEKQPQERLLEHNSGSNKWTKENKPFWLLYFEEYLCKGDALKREVFYKTGFGRKIKDVIINTLDR